MKIIPTQAYEVDDRVSSFKSLTSDVCKVIPDVLLATMNIYFAQYQKIKDNEHLPTRLQDYSIDKVSFEIITHLLLFYKYFSAIGCYKRAGTRTDQLYRALTVQNARRH